MKAAEYIKKLNEKVDELDGESAIELYNQMSHPAFRLYDDTLDAIGDGYIDYLTTDQLSSYDYEDCSFTVKLDDGKVIVKEGINGIETVLVPNRKEAPRPVRPRNVLSHYERTRAMVYATGNRWAIENFEATH